jgi:hypothetical protein
VNQDIVVVDGSDNRAQVSRRNSAPPRIADRHFCTVAMAIDIRLLVGNHPLAQG